MPLSGPPALLSAIAASSGDAAAGVDSAKYVTPAALRGSIEEFYLRTPRVSGLTIIFEGDSNTDPGGIGTTNSTSTWPYYLARDFAWATGATRVNSAASGSLVATAVARYAASVYPSRPSSSAVDSVLLVLLGTNDLNVGTAATTIYAALKGYWATAKADGFRLAAFTIPPAGTWNAAKEAERIALNKLIRSDRSLFDWLIEPDTFAIRTFDAYWFQADTLHFTAATNLQISREVNRVLVPSQGMPTPEGLSEIASFLKGLLDGTKGRRGTQTNDNADSSEIGYYDSASVAYGARVSLSSGTPANAVPILLPSGGDWDVTGICVISCAGANVSAIQIGISTGGVIGSFGDYIQDTVPKAGLSAQLYLQLPIVRFTVATATWVYVVPSVSFSAGTVDAFGFIRIRRAR